jgi:hypothetical protein
VGLDDDFFAVGGASVQSVEIVARVGGRLGLGLGPDLVFAYPTVRAFAAHLDDVR